MVDSTHPPLLQPGKPAPDFVLPTVNRDGTVALREYRGRSPLLLAVFRGLHCAFCRRHIARLGLTQQRLADIGVETLAITASPLERARLYMRFHPTRVLLAADPEMTTHRLYGLPPIAPTPELEQLLTSMYRDLARQGGASVPAAASQTEVVNTVGRLDGFEMTESDWAARGHREGKTGQFLIDRDGTVVWVNVEGDREGLAGLGKFPSDDELLAAVQSVLP